MDSLGLTRFPDYQAIIIVDYDDGRLFPLTDGCPKCLLPIANRRLLAYQLDLLSKSGALEIYIAAPREYQAQLSQFLSEYGNTDSASVEFVWVDDMTGSADGLRAVHDRIRGDFICMGSDMICQYSFGEIADLHRSRGSDLTMLLVSAPSEDSEKKGAPKKIRIEEEDQEYIGVCEDGRVVMKTPALEIDEALQILKPLLHRCTSSLTVRNDLLDLGVYLMSHWILDFLMANKKISNLRTELVPFLVNRQYQSEQYLDSVIPALRGRKGTLSVLDKWLTQIENNKNSPENAIYSSGNQELVDYLYQDIGGSKVPRVINSVSSKDLKDFASLPADNNQSAQTSSKQYESVEKVISNHNTDILRCFAIVYERKGCKGAHGSQTLYREMDGLHLMQRVTTLQSYMNLNRDLPAHPHDSATTWPAVAGIHKKEMCVIGESCELGDKVTVKQSCIGKGCQIGAKSKLNNCVVMDYTIIGESCTIQNSVISAGSVIESNCNINECYLGGGAKIAAGSKIKSESISSAT